MPSDLAYHGALGDFFADHADNSRHNAHVDRPAVLELIGDVAGQRILDAGCGAGHHANSLLAAGASVVGLDASATLLAHARIRLGDRAELRLQDLDDPLDTVEDASFDGALCALVLHHLRNRPAFLREVFRVLRPGGWFTVTTTHPTSDWRHFGKSYFSQEWVDSRLPGGHSIRFQLMTIETLVSEVLAAGFIVERLIEPRPVAALRDVDPVGFDKLDHAPSLLALRLRRP